MIFSKNFNLPYILLINILFFIFFSLSKASYHISDKSELPFTNEKLRPFSVLSFENNLQHFKTKILEILDAEKDVFQLYQRFLEEKKIALTESQIKYLNDYKLNKRILLPHQMLESKFGNYSDLLIKNHSPDIHHSEGNELDSIKLLVKDIEGFLSLPDTPVVQPLKEISTYYQAFLQKFCNAGSSQRELMMKSRASLSLEELGPYLISHETARTIFSINLFGGSIRSPDQDGNATAYPHPKGIHFKKFMSSIGRGSPAMEWAMNAFHYLLMGQGTPPTAFLTLHNVSFLKCTEDASESKTTYLTKVEYVTEEQMTPLMFFNKYPHLKDDFEEKYTVGCLQASLTSGYISFQEFLEEKRSFDEINLSSVAAIMIPSLAVIPSDMKSDNIRVTKDGKLISIDNDHALAEMIVLNRKTGQHEIEGKNVLYLIEELMSKNILSEDIDRFISHSPFLMILDWLDILEQQQKRYEDLRNIINHINNDSFPSEPSFYELRREQFDKYFPLKVKPGITLTILERLLKMNKFMRDWKAKNAKLTFQDLFIEMEPIASAYYTNLRRRYPNILEAQNDLWGKPLSLEEIITDHNIISQLSSFKTPRGMYDSEKTRTSTITDELILFLNSFNSSILTDYEKLAVVSKVTCTWPHLSSFLISEFWRDPQLLKKIIDEICRSKVPQGGVIVDFLIKAGLASYNYHEVDESGNTLLHQIVETLDIPNLNSLIHILIQAGAPFEVKNQHGSTPLDIALLNNNKEAFLSLIQQGAGRNIKESLLDDFYKKHFQDFELQDAFQLLKNHNPLMDWVMLKHVFFQPSSTSSFILKNAYPPNVHSFSPIHYKQLFDSKGTFLRVNHKGHRDVGLLEDGQRALFIKKYPSFSGIEYAIKQLVQLLFSRGISHSSLIKINDEPYLISQAFGRNIEDQNSNERISPYIKNNLDFILTTAALNDNSRDCLEAKRKLSLIDKASFSEAVIIAMLTNPEDGQPANYVLERIIGDKELYQIIGIDNDQALVPEASAPPSQSITSIIFKKPTPHVQVKCWLYCWAERMHEPIEPTVVSLLTSFNEESIVQLLKRWLEDLQDYDKAVQFLFPDQQFWSKHGCYIGVPLQKGDIKDIYIKLMTIVSRLKQNPKMTHYELLKVVLPFAASHYRPVLTKLTELHSSQPLSIYESFLDRDGAAYGIFPKKERHIFASLTSTANILESKNIKVKKSRKQAIEDQDIFTLENALSELDEAAQAYEKDQLSDLSKQGGNNLTLRKILKGKAPSILSFDLKNFSPYKQQKILKNLENKKFEELSLTFSSELKLTFFENSRDYLGNLTSLDLRGCLHVNTNLLLLLSRKCPSLKKLNLAKCLNLKAVAQTRPLLSSVELEFNSLLDLNLSDCEALEELQFCINGIERLWVNNCPQLKTINLSPKPEKRKFFSGPFFTDPDYHFNYYDFKYFSISGNSYINKEKLIQLFEEFPYLSTVNITGCRRLSTLEKLNSFYPQFTYREILLSPALKYILEKAFPFEVPYIDSLQFGYNITSAELWGIIPKLTTFTLLNLEHSQIRDDSITILKPMTQLTFLNLSRNKITYEGVKGLTCFTNLNSLNLSYNDIKHEGSKALAKLTNLTRLTLDIVPETIKELTTLVNLIDLNLNGSDVDCEISKAIASFTKLQSLNLSKNRFEPGILLGMEFLSTLTNLTELNSNWHNVGFNDLGFNKGAKVFKSLTALKYLYLGGNEINSEGLEFLITLTNLVALDLNTESTANRENGGIVQLSNLTNLTNLTFLDLSYNVIKPERSETLKSLTALKYLYLEGCRIYGKNLEFLITLTNLVALNLNITEIGREGAVQLLNLTNLISLGLRTLYNTHNLNAIISLSKLTNLKYLDVSGVENITDYLDYFSKVSTLVVKESWRKPFPGKRLF